MKNGENISMEKELINYILEILDGADCVCEELHECENEVDYCRQNCQNLNESCIRRLMYHRIINNKNK